MCTFVGAQLWIVTTESIQSRRQHGHRVGIAWETTQCDTKPLVNLRIIENTCFELLDLFSCRKLTVN